MNKAVLSDFRNFLYIANKALKLPDPTPVHYDMADFLTSGYKKLILQCGRSMGKSHLVSLYTIWLLLRNREEKVLVVSAAADRATDFANFCRNTIELIPMCQHLVPENKSRSSWSTSSFTVAGCKPSHNDSITAVGINSHITGKRATRVICDDVESLDNSLTASSRDLLLKKTAELDIIIGNNVNSSLIYLCTPQSKESIYIPIQEKGYVRRVYPVEVPKSPEYYRGDLAPYVVKMFNEGHVGKSVDPLMHSEERLKDIRKEQSKSGYALQYMLDTRETDETRYPLRAEQLIVSNAITKEHGFEFITDDGVRGEKVRYQQKVLSIDPSGTGRDLCAYVVLGACNSHICILDLGGFENGYEDATFLHFKRLCEHYKINNVIVERNFGGGTYTALLRKYVNYNIEEVTSQTRKELRIIDTLEPVLNQRNLIITRKLYDEHKNPPTGFRSHHSLIFQLNNLTRDRDSLPHDDMVDALSIGVYFLQNHLKFDSQKLAEQRARKEREKEIRKFMQRWNTRRKQPDFNRTKFYL